MCVWAGLPVPKKSRYGLVEPWNARKVEPSQLMSRHLLRFPLLKSNSNPSTALSSGRHRPSPVHAKPFDEGSSSFATLFSPYFASIAVLSSRRFRFCAVTQSSPLTVTLPPLIELPPHKLKYFLLWKRLATHLDVAHKRGTVSCHFLANNCDLNQPILSLFPRFCELVNRPKNRAYSRFRNHSFLSSPL